MNAPRMIFLERQGLSLDPPAEICGRLAFDRKRFASRKHLAEIHRQRADWVKEQADHGASYETIADALGVNHQTVRLILREWGWKRPAKSDFRASWHGMHSVGIDGGRMSVSFNRAPLPVRHALADEAMKRNKTLVDTLLALFEESLPAGV